MTARVLVTGGAGFIGSHLVRELAGRGLEVRVLDNFATGKWSNLAPVLDRVQVIEGDLRNLDNCMEACADVDLIYHLGALGSVPRSVDDPLTSHAVNATGTLNILQAARTSGARRLVFSSSSSVYGDTPVLPKHEGMALSPRSPYAVTKLAGEEYCRAFYRTYGFETVILRYFNVFGPRQDPKSAYAAVIPKFVSALLEGRQPVIFGDGMQARDFTYVTNVVHANILAATAPGVAGEVFNVACGEQIVLREVLDGIADLLGIPCTPQYEGPRVGDVRNSLADISAAQKLGYRPRVLFEEGLERAVRFYVEQHRGANFVERPSTLTAA